MRGSRPGERRGGRQRGMKNKRTMKLELARADTAEKITAALGEDGFAGDAHAFLVTVYKNMAHPLDLRVHAAKAAIAYEKPRIAAADTTHTGDGLSLVELINQSYQPKPAKEEDQQ